MSGVHIPTKPTPRKYNGELSTPVASCPPSIQLMFIFLWTKVHSSFPPPKDSSSMSDSAIVFLLVPLQGKGRKRKGGKWHHVKYKNRHPQTNPSHSFIHRPIQNTSLLGLRGLWGWNSLSNGFLARPQLWNYEDPKNVQPHSQWCQLLRLCYTDYIHCNKWYKVHLFNMRHVRILSASNIYWGLLPNYHGFFNVNPLFHSPRRLRIGDRLDSLALTWYLT